MAISLNRLIKVNPSVIKAAGNAIDLNGVILADNPYIPIGTALTFKAADTVKDRFGASSDEYKAAQVYFKGVKNGTKSPSSLIFARFNIAASNAALIGIPLKLTLVQLQALKGDIALSVNGKAKTASIDLSAATSFSNAAEIIATAVKNVTVDYNSLTNQFKITATGDDYAATSITAATGDVATSLGLTSAIGAYVSNPNKAEDADGFFTKLLASTANWYSFTTLFEPTDAQHLDFASWVNSQNARFNYVMWTSSTTALVSGSTETIAAQVKEKSYASITPVYSSGYLNVINVLGYYATLNFDQVGGRVPLHYRTLDGLSADVKSNADYDALEANGYNFYGNYAANIDSYSIWQDGSVTGDFMWADAHSGQAWLNANVQLTILSTLMGNASIPYNAAGREAFAAPLVGIMEQFKTWGGCSAGTDLDSGQVLQIKNLLGYDASPALIAKGYVIYIGAFTSTMRANRTTPSCYILYADGGAFRTITLNSVEVQ